MLADGKIDSLDRHLEQFRLNDQRRQDDLQNLLKEYSQLLDDYKVLRKAFEAKGKLSTLAPRAPPVLPSQSPYVLVLIDGNDYIFNDELIREKEEGGMLAARMLNDAVEKYIHQSVPEARTARVVVRVYADLTNLSKQLAKNKVTGLEKRSIAAFTAAFTRAIGLFDFVDALDGEGTRFKIREQFKLVAEDSACSHIFFAACHDPAYLSALVPLSGARDKVTLVQGAGWNPEFHQFNLNVTQFPTVFRWSEVPVGVVSTTKATVSDGGFVAKPVPGPRPILVKIPSTRAESWRRDRSLSVTDSAFGTDDGSSAVNNGFSNGNGVSSTNKSAQFVKASKQPCKYFAKGSCRFGPKCNFAHPPTSNTTTTTRPNPQSNSTIPSHSNPRFTTNKPCNAFHIIGTCNTPRCPYDHSALDPEAVDALRHALKSTLCPRKDTCRKEGCWFGHGDVKDDGSDGEQQGGREEGVAVGRTETETETETGSVETLEVGETPGEGGFYW